jgi:hypothetical protein
MIEAFYLPQMISRTYMQYFFAFDFSKLSPLAIASPRDQKVLEESPPPIWVSFSCAQRAGADSHER